MTEMEITDGRCLCGSVRFVYEGRPRWVMHCHCESCRRNCAAPFTTFVGVKDGRWRWTGEEPAVFRSSAGVERLFCAKCGTPMAYRADHWPGEIHFYAAAHTDPGALTPTAHVHAAERLPWIHLADDLPQHSGTAV